MAGAPSYTNDLTTIVDFDGTPSSPSVSEPASVWTAGRSPVVDTDFPIQSTNHASLTMNTTGKAGIFCDNGASFSWTSGHYLFGWIIWLAPGAIAERTSGGLAMLCGSSVSVYKVFYVGGKAFGLYPYGGWQNFAVDPTMTPSETIGSPTAYYIVGSGANVLSAVSKGNPLGFDVFRYGRGIFRIANGESGNYATFTGMAAANDATAARWGLFQFVQGGYKYKGLMYFGYGALTEFVDSNKSIVIDEMIFVQSNFNRIEFHNASSIISWNNISFNSIATVSPGQLEVVDNCTLTFDGCTFQNMDTFIFQSNSNVINTIFVKCKAITSGGGVFNGSKVLTPTIVADASAFSWDIAIDSDGHMDDMTFSKGTNAHHAIEFGMSAPTTIVLNGVAFSGFNASNEQNDSTLYFADKGSDTTWTVNCTGCTGNITYKRARVTDTVNINLDQVTHKLSNLKDASEVTYVERGTADDTGSDGSTMADSRDFVTTNSWTTDEHKGKLLYITSGADAGRYYISGNSATTLYLDAKMTATAGSLTWELYDENNDTEIYHVESVTGNQSSYTYTYGGDVTVDIIIIHQDYEQIVLEDIVLGDTSQTLPQSQRKDDNYYNP